MALCVALLVERKLANYDDLIIKYWPNFGDNNKANITIKMLLTDKNEQPKWPPEEKSGCYGSLFYWLIDQLIRHIDKQKRGVQQYFHDEIASKFGIDYSIGLMKTEEYRLARIAMPSWFDIFSEIYQTPHLMSNLLFQFFTHKDSIMYKVMNNLKWLNPIIPLQINNPNFHHLLYNGFGNARSLAQLFHMLSTDKLLSPANQFLLEKISINSTDICTIKHLAKNIGLLVFIDQSQHSITSSDLCPHLTHLQVSHAYGHSAFGCQQVIHDRRNNLTIAYVTNAIKVGVYKQCRTYI
ncbi:unnamed protein product, partial [Brugia pahangi]|uniref:Beta-lactamase domain-containing protein n=1 Tax=Brugia pahangi TaxID=6280 RepID=A0A0N4TB62_BRUPA